MSENKVCDICSKSLTSSEMKKVSSTKMMLLTSTGFIPKAAKDLGAAGAALGLSTSGMWQDTVNNQFGEWGVCMECKNEILKSTLLRLWILIFLIICVIAGGFILFM